MALDIKKFVLRFIEEAREHLGQLSNGLSELAADGAKQDTINAIFRSAHTIKGSARMLKLMPISDTAHHLEDVLGALREGSIRFSADLGSVLYRAVDALDEMVNGLAGSLDGASLPAANAELCERLSKAAKGDAGAAPGAPASSPAAAPLAPVEQVPAPAESATAPAPHQAPTPSKPNLPTPGNLGNLSKAPDTVRVRLNKLDELIKLMGEVVASHASMRERLIEVRELEREGAPSAGQGADPHAGQQGRLHRFVQALRNDVQAQELLMDELHDKALIMRMLPLGVIFDSAGKILRDLARTVGKDIDCVISGAEIELDRQMIDRLSDPLIHLLRNAVDHGIESPERRLAAGKPARGKVSISAYQDGSWVVIEVGDDGGGISTRAVLDKAVKRGIVSAERAPLMAEQEILELIFLPGFSTSAIITDLSGRGVGMDVVKACIVDELRGAINLNTELGVGSSFSLRLPLSLAVMRVLQVSVDGTPFGLTAQYFSELRRVPIAQIGNVADRDTVIIRNEFVPVVAMRTLLHLPRVSISPTLKPREQDLLLLVVHVRGEKLALIIDELVDERDMVIKQLPPHMNQLTLISGMVINGRNELVSVLHIPALFELARQSRGQSIEAQAASRRGELQSAQKKILVVDDSLNTREIERDVLEAWGYHVTLAKDGLDGLNKAREGEFDAILTDVEMPRMDGFTLTAQLRQEAKYLSTPIIIITSLEKQEDKLRGIQVGADAYIVKGDFNQDTLINTLRSLLA